MSEIKSSINALFSAVDIPTDRIRARKSAHVFSTIHSIAEHGVDLLQEQYEAIQQNIGELRNQAYPSRCSGKPDPDKINQLANFELERQIVFSVLELLTCLKQQSGLKYKTGKQIEAMSAYAYSDTMTEGM